MPRIEQRNRAVTLSVRSAAKQERPMTVRPEFDRPDPNLAAPRDAAIVDPLSRKRGAYEQSRDISQHRRYTAFYEDLQN
jgi:hypothetical protein